MQDYRHVILIAGIGLVALATPQTVAYMRHGGIRRRYLDTLFALGCMMIAQYFV